MRNYELNILFSPDLAQEQLQEQLSLLTASLQDTGAIVMNQDLKGRRKLVAPVKKHQESQLATMRFTLDPKKLREVERGLKAKDAILRFLLLSWKQRKAEAVPSSQQTVIAQKPEEQEPKVELEDIDKKLEEIFKTEPLL